MKMSLSCLIYLLVACKVSGNPTAYDQRQTGDVNVQVHLKDVQVVALIDTELLEDYTDYNYSYDYSDFTIKPPPRPSGSNTTANPWHTWPTNPPNSTSKMNNTDETPTSTISPSSNDNSTFLLSSNLNSTTPSGEMTIDPLSDSFNVSSSEQPGLKHGRVRLCQAGYHRDGKGRCKKEQRRRFSFLPFAMRMLPKRPETQPAT